MVPAFAAVLFGDHEIGFFKHFQMLHDSAAIHVGEGLAEHAGRARRVLEHVEDFASATMRKGLENEVAV